MEHRIFKTIQKNRQRLMGKKSGKKPNKIFKRSITRKLETASKDLIFLHEYDKNVENFESYMESKDTWFANKYPENKKDLIAYFSRIRTRRNNTNILRWTWNIIRRSLKISK